MHCAWIRDLRLIDSVRAERFAAEERARARRPPVAGAAAQHTFGLDCDSGRRTFRCVLGV
ncbi:hypothetical protein GCM10023319_83120 [Nocardia iowensis]